MLSGDKNVWRMESSFHGVYWQSTSDTRIQIAELRQYLSIETLEHSAAAYEAAKEGLKGNLAVRKEKWRFI